MKLIRLKTINWLSFKELDYNFVDKPLQIQGENLTEVDQESNGSGKSAIQAAIEKLILDSTSRKVRDESLINFDSESSELELSIYCPVREETLKIERILHRTKGGSSQISINGKVKYSFEDRVSNEINSFIVEWIGIAKEDIQNAFIINKERFVSFFSSSNSKKIELVNRFSNANIIDGIELIIKKDVLEKEKEKRDIQNKLSKEEGKLENCIDMILREENRDLNKENRDKIERLNSTIRSIKEKISTDKENITRINSEISSKKNSLSILESNLISINKELSSVKVIDFSKKIEELYREKEKVNKEISTKKSKKNEYEDTYNEAIEMLNEIERNIKGSVKCPKCNYRFLIGKLDVNIEEEEKSKKEVESIISETKEYLNNLKLTINSVVQDRLNPLQEEERRLSEEEEMTKRRIRKIQNDIYQIESDISRYRSGIENKKEEISRIENSIQNSKNSIKDYEIKIKELEKINIENNPVLEELKNSKKVFEKNIEVEREALLKKEEEIFQTNHWVYNFKKFKMYLAEKFIKIIQGYCNKYLIEMRSDIRIKIEGFRIKSDGSIKEEITPYIIRDGEVRNFWSFSGGERGRLEYSMILALQFMINSTNKYGGLQFLSTDEAVEGIDSIGLDNIINSLQAFRFPILITTHVQNKQNFDNVLRVVKENSISRIIN